MLGLKKRQRSLVGTPVLADGTGFSSIEPWIASFMGGYGANMSPLFMERLGAVNRCLQLTSQQVSAMPIKYFGKSPQPPWTNNPEPEYYNDIGEAMFAAVWSRYSRGETFFYVTSRFATGFPATWIVLDPVTMTVEADDYGAPIYSSNGYPLPREDVLHVKRDPRAGSLRGTPALQAYWSNLASAWSSETFAANNFDRSGVPATVLKWHEGKLTQKQAQELQAQWVAAVSNRQGAPAVLDQNLDFSVLAFSPRDLMLLELREFDTKQIASAFGVPAFLLNLAMSGGLTYQNPAQLFEIWWRAELLPNAHALSAGLSNWLPGGNWIEFDPSLVLRPDFQTMVNSYVQLLNANVVTADEVRARVLNLPPMSEGEALGLTEQPGVTAPDAQSVNVAAPLTAVN